jgi:hypothetical protein
MSSSTCPYKLNESKIKRLASSQISYSKLREFGTTKKRVFTDKGLPNKLSLISFSLRSEKRELCGLIERAS